MTPGEKYVEQHDHRQDPYPGLVGRLFMKGFDTDRSLPLVRYRILVDGEEDAAGEFRCRRSRALATAKALLGGRYQRLGPRLAEVEVRDAGGSLLGSDRQVRSSLNGTPMVLWASQVRRRERFAGTDALVRSLGPPSLA